MPPHSIIKFFTHLKSRQLLQDALKGVDDNLYDNLRYKWRPALKGSSLLKRLLNWLLQLTPLQVVFRWEYRRLVSEHDILSGISKVSPRLIADSIDTIHCLAGRETVRVLQIGANDGAQNDFMQDIYKKNFIEAVLVEPQRMVFEQLCLKYPSNPRIKTVNFAITSNGEELKLFRLPQNVGTVKTDVLASFDRRYIESWRRRLGLDCEIEEEVVRGTTIKELLRLTSWDSVDVIIIDTEGYDYEIVKTLPSLQAQPFLLVFEHINLQQDDKLASIKFVQDMGYSVIWMETDIVCWVPFPQRKR